VIIPPVGGTRWNGYRSRNRANSARFLLASISGAVIVGLTAGVLGEWAFDNWPHGKIGCSVAVAILSTIYGVRELVGKPLPVPTRHWMVPRHWGLMGDRWFAVTFGFLLGAGVFTIVPFIGFYTLILCVGLLHNIYEAMAILAAFGLTRGLPVLLTAMSLHPIQTFRGDLLLGITKGYSIVDASSIRRLRIASLLLSSATIIPFHG